MKKELPKVYVNKIDKEFKNNEKVVYNKSNYVEPVNRVENLKKELSGNINQKIKKIFNDPNYIYKADVIITLKDKEIKKRIIGKSGNFIITYDNELISISDIVDIKYR